MNPTTRLYSIALVLAGACSHLLSAQVVPTVIPPSPEASTILKHSPVNVSLYTGTPNISVPFYTISLGGIEVPVSLSYSSDGIRVENVASSAGLGWSLNAGGIISRSINKLPDDVTSGYMNTPRTMAAFLLRDEGIHVGSRQGELWTTIGDGATGDYEPDIFSFSFLNYSGQFYYNRTENDFNQAPLSNLKIDAVKTAGIIQGFVITDEAGIRYHFGKSKNGSRTAREALKDVKVKTIIGGLTYEHAPLSSIGALNAFQSWMLLDIEFPNSSQTIEFKYIMESDVKTYMLTDESYSRGFTDGENCQKTSIGYMLKTFDQPRLELITFPNGKVKFENETVQRLDLKKSYALRNMQLLDGSEQVVRKMQLHTSYLQSVAVNPGQFHSFLDLTEGSYRLQLDSISLQDKDNLTSGRYKFAYNSKKLPNRYSRSVDYFGYFNGKTNTSFLSKIPLSVQQAGNTVLTFLIGNANRSVDSNFTNASVLERITYPTGGFDEFTWETNKASRLFGSKSSYRDELVDVDDFYFINDTALPGITLQGSTYSKTLVVPDNVMGVFEFAITMTDCNTPGLNQVDCHFELKIAGVTDPAFQMNILQKNFNLNTTHLPAGTYKVTARSKVPIVNPNQQTGTGPFPSFTMSVKWSYDPDPNQWTYSGLRIQEIKTYDRLGSKAFSKSYDYRYLDPASNTYKSSGNVINCLDVLDEQYYVFCPRDNSEVSGGDPFLDQADYRGPGFQLTARSQSWEQSTKGGPVGYTTVTEKFNNGLGGYNRYEYSFVDGYNSQVQLVPVFDNNFIPPEIPSLLYLPDNFKQKPSSDWLNGNLKIMETFDSNNIKIKSAVYDYEVARTKTIDYFGIQTRDGGNVQNDTQFGGFCPCNIVKAAFYSAVTEYHRLKSVTETDYFDGALNSVKISKDYSYNLFSQILKETVIEDEQKATATRYFYPNDPFISDRPFVTELRAQNRIGEPLVVEKYQGTNRDNLEKLSTQETVYKDWDTGVGLYLAPEIIKTSKGLAVMEPRVTYNAMDITTGNPLEVEQTGGTKISYLWGYNKAHPIAKIENASNAEIKTALGVADLTLVNEANWTAINNLRTLLPNAMVTTYTFTPLVGITSITDPKGDKITYHYDNFKRLEVVKDGQGRILGEHKYNYRTQN